MRVVFLRSNSIDPDPRVEKEIRALTAIGIECLCVGWDRSQSYGIRTFKKKIMEGYIEANLIGIESPFGTGVKNAPRTLRFIKRLHKWLLENSEKYDVIHACDLDTGIAAKAASRRIGKPYVYDIFDFFSDSRIMPNALKGLVKRVEFGVIDSSRVVIICTDQRRGQLKGSAPKEIVVVENTPEEQMVTEVKDALGHEIRLAYVGVLTEGRYIDKILDIVDVNDDLALDIGGFGPLGSMVESRALSNPRIVFHGKVSYDTALLLEKSADVMFALYDPSIANHRMAAPNKYYESLMLGVPLITIMDTSVGEWVEREKTGVTLAPDFTLYDLYQAIKDAVSANVDGDISRRQRDLYRSKHSWSVMEKRLQTLYSTLYDELVGGEMQ